MPLKHILLEFGVEVIHGLLVEFALFGLIELRCITLLLVLLEAVLHRAKTLVLLDEFDGLEVLEVVADRVAHQTLREEVPNL